MAGGPLRLFLPFVVLCMGCPRSGAPAAGGAAARAAPGTDAPADVDAHRDWGGRVGRAAEAGPEARPRVLWRVQLPAPVEGGIAVGGELAFVVSDGAVHAVDRAGQTRWRAAVSAVGRPVVVDGGQVAVGTADGVVLLLDPLTGAGPAGLPSGGAVVDGVSFWEGVLAWATDEGRVVGADGHVVELGGPPSGGLAAHGRLAFIGRRDGALLGLGAQGPRWQLDLPGPVLGTPRTDGGAVVVAWGPALGTAGGVLCAAAGTGQERWRVSLGSEPAAPPAWGPGLIVVGELGGDLVGLDPTTGAELWRNTSTGAWSAAPTLAARSVFAVEVQGRAVRVDPDDGGEIWSVDLGSAVTLSPAVRGDQLLVALESGELVALGAAP